MRICDKCRDIKKPVLGLRVGIDKPNPENGREKPKEYRSTEFELCEDCVEPVWGAMLASLKECFG